jgi:hypothetical protein
MALKISEQVQVIVENTDPDGTVFRDAIYVTQQQRAVLTDADLVVMGNARVTAWKAAVEAAKNAPPYVPTKEEVQAQLESMVQQKVLLDAQLAAVDPAKLEAAYVAIGVAVPIDVKPVDVLPVKG